MLPPVLKGLLDPLARTWRRVEVLRDIADNEGGAGLGSADLLDLYVPAWLCLDRDVRGVQENERALYRKLREPELSPDERTQIAQSHQNNLLQPWFPEWRMARRFSPLQALAEHRHLAVVAPPGAGKSTLLRVVALAQIDPTFADLWGEERTPEPGLAPVLLRLADYAEALASEPELALATFVARAAAYAEEPLRAGQALLLLDGLDEVPLPSLRKRIASAIRALLDATPELRCVVTTRPNGAVHLPGFAVFHLDLFSEAMAVEFLARWRACQQRDRGEAIDRAALHAQAAAIWQRLRAHPSLLALARNPLLLAILAVCQEMHVEMPHDRVQFYEHALRTLLGTWDHGREEDDNPQVALETQWRAWGELALELRTMCPAGVFRRDLLVERLTAWLVAFGEREADGRRLAEAMFDAAVHRHGLLERLGGGDFKFWHPTFGEYLAAAAIARDPDPQRLVGLRDDLRNTEIAAMVLAHVATVQGDRRRANAWLAALAREDDAGWGPLVGSAMAFAVECVRRGCAADHEAVEALLALAARQITLLPYGHWSSPFCRLVEGYPRFCPGPPLVAKLLPLSRPPRAVGTAWARASAMRLLASACATDRAARDACRVVAPTWRERSKLFGAHESVGHAGLGLLRAGEPASAWLPAITGLTWFLDRGDPLALSDDARPLREALRRMIPALGERLADTDPDVRRAAALALALVDDARPAVQDELFAAAEGTTTDPSAERLLARLAHHEAAIGERLVVLALHAAATDERADAWSRVCLERALTAAGEHCRGGVRRLVDALAGELDRPDGPAQKLLARLVSHERPHLAGVLLAEAEARLFADPDATRLALRSVLLTKDSFAGSPGPTATELLFTCARRGGIDQRFIAHDRIGQAYYSQEFARQRGRLAALEVELLAEALAHAAGENLVWAPSWEERHLGHMSRPRTWGSLVEQLVGSIEHRLEASPDQAAAYLMPLRDAFASSDDRLRHYAAVLLAPVSTGDEERAGLAPSLVDLLATKDRWLRVRAAAWLVDQRAELAAAGDVAIERLQLALCAEPATFSGSEFAERLVRLGPPSDEVIHALLREEFPVERVDPNWLFARIEVVELIASYLGNADDRLHKRAQSLLGRGRGRDDITELLYRRGLAAGPDDAASLAARLGSDLASLDKPQDPRVTSLWRRALASTHLGVKARAFAAVVWHVEPDATLREAALAVLAGESRYLRILVARDCVTVVLRDRDMPADVGACVSGLDALGVPAGRLIAALLPILDEKGPLLRAAAAVLLHVLGGPCEQVHALLAPLRGVDAPLHMHFNFWGPDWGRLAQLVVPSQFLEYFDSSIGVDGWTLGVQAVGLGSTDETLPGRLQAELEAALAGPDDFSQLDRAVLLLRIMLASSPEAAALGIEVVFSGLRTDADADAEEAEEDPAERRRWNIVEHVIEDDRMLAGAAKHVLHKWPAASSRQYALAPHGVSEGLRVRLRAVVRTFVQDPDPAIRGAAARWCVQLGDDDPAVLAAWVEGLFTESVVSRVFSRLAWLSPDEATRGVAYACAHPGLWQGSPVRTRTLLAMLDACSALPPGAAAVVGAGLASAELEHRCAAADLCARHPGLASSDELAAIWRDALIEFDVGDGACTIAQRLLAALPNEPVAIAALRRIAAGDYRHEARRACEALSACPSEQAFVRALLCGWIDDPDRDSRALGWALAQLLRAGEPEPVVAARAITAMVAERLDPADLAPHGAGRRLHGDGPKGWPTMRGGELAQQPTILAEALAAALAACLGADINVVGPRWQRIAGDGPCTQDDVREVVALLSVRIDDDDRRLFARGYWYGRLPHDARQHLVLPRVARPAPPPRLPADPKAREDLLVRRFGDPERLRRFVEVWPELATEIAWQGQSIRNVVGELVRELSRHDLWEEFEQRLFAAGRPPPE
jgi:hypothetical protein